RTETRTATRRWPQRAPRSWPRLSRQRAYAGDAPCRRGEAATRRLLERAAEEEPGGERVARPGRVDDLSRHGCEIEARVGRDDRAAARAALQHAGRRGQVRSSEHLPLGFRR